MKIAVFLLISTFFTTNKAIANYDICFRGGWPSVMNKKNKCIEPWNLNYVHKNYLRGNKYIVDESTEVCPKKQFLCNPVIFHKKCVKYKRGKDMNASCLKDSDPMDQAYFLLNNELAREKFSNFLNTFVQKCKKSETENNDCDQLSDFVLKIKDSLIDLSLDQCRVMPNGMITVQDAQIDDILNLISKLENSPYIDESIPQYRALTQKQKIMFENYLKLGGNPKAFFHANCFLNRFSGKRFKMGSGNNKFVHLQTPQKDGKGCSFLINDYTKPSTKKRLFSINQCTGEVFAMPSAHGGGKGDNINSQGLAKNFGSGRGTNLSPTGFFILGKEHRSKKPWSPGIKMHGLQKQNKLDGFEGNENSRRRGVVLHRSSYVKGNISSSEERRPKTTNNKCGMTHGCLGVTYDSWDFITENLGGQYHRKNITDENGNIEISKGSESGPLLYTFGPYQSKQGNDYCGGDKKWLK